MQLIKIGHLAYASVLYLVAHSYNGTKDGIYTNHIAMLTINTIFYGTVATTSLYHQIHHKTGFVIVKRGYEVFGIYYLYIGIGSDIACRNFSFTLFGNSKCLRFVTKDAKPYTLEIEHNI